VAMVLFLIVLTITVIQFRFTREDG
jgi:ABC-type sugar transport system permease subunit